MEEEKETKEESLEETAVTPPSEEKKVETAPAAEARAPEKEEEEIEVVEERFYTIPLRRIWISPRENRAPRAVRVIRDLIARHMKTEEVSLSNEMNEKLWSRGISKPPRHVRVRAVKDKKDRVIIYPA